MGLPSRISDLPVSPFLNNMKATKQAAVVEIKKVEVEPEKIILELSVIEAKALGAMIGRVEDADFIDACVSDLHGLRMYRSEIPSRFNHVFYNKIISLFR